MSYKYSTKEYQQTKNMHVLAISINLVYVIIYFKRLLRKRSRNGGNVLKTGQITFVKKYSIEDVLPLPAGGTLNTSTIKYLKHILSFLHVK